MSEIFSESTIMKKIQQIKDTLNAIEIGDKHINTIDKESRQHLEFLDKIYSFKELREILEEFSKLKGKVNNKEILNSISDRLDAILESLKAKYDTVKTNKNNDELKEVATPKNLQLNNINIITATGDIDFNYVKELFIATNSNITSTIKYFDLNSEDIMKNKELINDRIEQLKLITNELNEKAIKSKEMFEKIPINDLSVDVEELNYFYVSECGENTADMTLSYFTTSKFKEEKGKIDEQKKKFAR